MSQKVTADNAERTSEESQTNDTHVIYSNRDVTQEKAGTAFPTVLVVSAATLSGGSYTSEIPLSSEKAYNDMLFDDVRNSLALNDSGLLQSWDRFLRDRKIICPQERVCEMGFVLGEEGRHASANKFYVVQALGFGMPPPSTYLHSVSYTCHYQWYCGDTFSHYEDGPTSQVTLSDMCASTRHQERHSEFDCPACGLPKFRRPSLMPVELHCSPMRTEATEKAKQTRPRRMCRNEWCDFFGSSSGEGYCSMCAKSGGGNMKAPKGYRNPADILADARRKPQYPMVSMRLRFERTSYPGAKEDLYGINLSAVSDCLEVRGPDGEKVRGRFFYDGTWKEHMHTDSLPSKQWQSHGPLPPGVYRVLLREAELPMEWGTASPVVGDLVWQFVVKSLPGESQRNVQLGRPLR